MRLVYDAHSAATQFLEKFVVADRGTRLRDRLADKRRRFERVGEGAPHAHRSVLPRVQERSERGRMTLTFFDWSLGEEGDKIAEKLGYVGLPARGKQYVRASLRRTFTDAGGDPLLR